MNPQDKNRNIYIEKAKFQFEQKNNFLSAVFFIDTYNQFIHFQPNAVPISPNEIFLEFEESEYIKALEKSRDLLTKTAYVGAAIWNYNDSMTVEGAKERMRTEYPGFSEECYKAAESHSMQQMR